MIPLDEHSFEYLGRRELTEADRLEARKMREEFEQTDDKLTESDLFNLIDSMYEKKEDE